MRREPCAARGYGMKRGAEGRGEDLRDIIPPALYIFWATPVSGLRPWPDAPSTLLSATPTHLGFKPPPRSLLGFPPHQPVSTLSSVAPPGAPSTVNCLDWGRGECSQLLMKVPITTGGDWGTQPSPSSPAIHDACPQPQTHPHGVPVPTLLTVSSSPKPLCGVSWLGLKGPG